MINEDYVSFETAKLLKEKGFDGSCHRYYRYDKEDIDGNGKMFMFASDLNGFCCVTNSLLNGYGDKHEETVLAPTIQMARKWLREVYKLEIYPFHYKGYPKNKWGYDIKKEMPLSVIDKFQMLAIFDSYEESCDAAIKHCLENLI